MTLGLAFVVLTASASGAAIHRYPSFIDT